MFLGSIYPNSKSSNSGVGSLAGKFPAITALKSPIDLHTFFGLIFTILNSLFLVGFVTFSKYTCGTGVVVITTSSSDDGSDV